MASERQGSAMQHQTIVTVFSRGGSLLYGEEYDTVTEAVTYALDEVSQRGRTALITYPQDHETGDSQTCRFEVERSPGRNNPIVDQVDALIRAGRKL